jgi:hypothetical protein
LPHCAERRIVHRSLFDGTLGRPANADSGDVEAIPAQWRFMRISKPEILDRDGEIVYRVGVESSAGAQTLWYSLGKQFGNLVTNNCDAPLAALLIPAMAYGEDIRIDGAISERLYYNLSRAYQCVLKHVMPPLHRVAIHPADLESGGQRASGVATGFSGGIDSYCVMADHHYGDLPAGFKITHLLFNNVGSHGAGAERLFLDRFARLTPLVERLGLPYIKINSNLNDFYPPGYDFQQTHTPRNVSAALLLQRGIGRFLYASAASYQDAGVGPHIAMGYEDTITLPLLGTEALETMSVGSEYTRVEKTLRVAEVPDSYETLDVCTCPDRAGNCSVCWKCMRTLATLDVAGLLQRYARVFDLNAYKRRRRKYIGIVLRGRDPLLREIARFIKQRRYAVPLTSRLYVIFYWPGTLVKRTFRLAKRVLQRLTRGKPANR